MPAATTTPQEIEFGLDSFGEVSTEPSGRLLSDAETVRLMMDEAVLAESVGIDSYNIDDTADLSRPAHTELLRAGILIIEHLTNLDSLPNEREIRLFAVPPKVRGLGSFPVRAFAMV